MMTTTPLLRRHHRRRRVALRRLRLAAVATLRRNPKTSRLPHLQIRRNNT